MMDPNEELTQINALVVVSEELSGLLDEWDDTDPVDRKMKLEEISASLSEALKME